MGRVWENWLKINWPGGVRAARPSIDAIDGCAAIVGSVEKRRDGMQPVTIVSGHFSSQTVSNRQLL